MTAQRSKDGGNKTVIAALAANLGIAVTKFAAAAYTGSSSMLAEGIHSLVDTANQGFLLLGIHRAKKPADAAHPFGHGVEVYFWSFIVAILIFALGAGFSIYEGVVRLLEPASAAIEAPLVALGVLAVALAMEGYSLSVAYSEFGAQRDPSAANGLLADVRAMKDPTIFVVLFEDSAACIGILIAAAGIGLAWSTGIAEFDAIGSIVIGVVLAVTAVLLVVETKGLLIGEAASPAMVATIRDRVSERPEIVSVNEIRTLHLGPRDVLLTMSCDFKDDVLSQDIEAAVSEIEQRVKRAYPIVRRLYIEVQSNAGHRLALAEESAAAD
ncbi:cation diffusion facilitator family transporter [Aurantimonas sp. HBX-1]|uniref:cation diffusion facilitator family transporter n=1 Tax=Aurantimonas sp. HBX-1 TaxID=2906072 RepID=UPI001F40F1C5|nr:cation diffusion facilitator family transporter [Aurantimonas sp. HBX-1]UIJ73720.1 cation diffusion facilitator family transporter [Aurantimonas sp. HBX-1]